MSIPSSHGGDLVFILRSHKGFTKRINKAAEAEALGGSGTQKTHHVSVEGSYGASNQDFAAFDTVILVAGATGVSYTLPILLDIAHRASTQKLPVRKVIFMWVVKSRAGSGWLTSELTEAAKQLRDVGIEVEIKISVTCDETLTEFEDGLTTHKTTCCCVPTECQCGLPDTKLRSADDIEEISSGSDSETEKKAVHIETRALDLISGRPQLRDSIWRVLDESKGETGIAVCGPLGLSSSVRTTVATISDHRGCGKSWDPRVGSEGVYLHVEGFAW
jgi:ferric-chelate reductase